MFLKLANICFKNIKFPRGNYQPIVPRQKHSIVKIENDNIANQIHGFTIDYGKFILNSVSTRQISDVTLELRATNQSNCSVSGIDCRRFLLSPPPTPSRSSPPHFSPICLYPRCATLLARLLARLFDLAA